jgi:hypothetical protein
MDLHLPNLSVPDHPDLAPANAGATRAGPAMALRLLRQLETTGRIARQDLEAANALIRETAPPLELDGLRHMAALGAALTGDIQTALDHLAPHGQRDAEAIGPVFASLVTSLMDREDTAPLLLLLSAEEFGQFGHFPNPAVRRRVSEYLLAHGLPDLSRDLILAGGSDHARDREVLTSAFDRLARDQAVPAPLPPSEPARPAPAAASPTEITTLLQRSRDMRATAAAILAGAPVPASH